jgi:hypothetical protein
VGLRRGLRGFGASLAAFGAAAPSVARGIHRVYERQRVPCGA